MGHRLTAGTLGDAGPPRRLKLGVGALMLLVAYGAYWLAATRWVLDSRPLEVALRNLRSPRVELRREAAGELWIWRQDPPRVIRALVDALRDPDPSVRAAAARSLGLLGPAAAEARPVLDGLRGDPSSEVRAAADEALDALVARPGPG